MGIDRDLLNHYPYFQKCLKTYPELMAILDPVADVDSGLFHRVILRGINNFEMPPEQIIALHTLHGNNPQSLFDALFKALKFLNMKRILDTYAKGDVLLIETLIDLQSENVHSFIRILGYFRKNDFDDVQFRKLCEHYDYNTKRIAASILNPEALKSLQNNPDDPTNQILETMVKKKQQAQKLMVEQDEITRELKQLERDFDAGSISQVWIDKRMAILQPRHETLKTEIAVYLQFMEGFRVFISEKYGVELNSIFNKGDNR